MSIDEAKINLDNLQIDKVLASYDGPMLFVNKDADGNYYLAYCCDVDEDEYVIAATSVRDLITMLENDKTVYSVFQKASNKWKVHSDSSVERVAKFNDLDLLKSVNGIPIWKFRTTFSGQDIRITSSIILL